MLGMGNFKPKFTSSNKYTKCCVLPEYEAASMHYLLPTFPDH